MAIVVLVLWVVTAGAGFYLLISGSLGHLAASHPLAGQPPTPATALPEPATASPESAATSAAPSPEPVATSAAPPREPVATSAAPPPVAGPAASAQSRVATSSKKPQDRWAPPSLVASRQAPALPGARALAEFAHPAAGIIGLGFWLGFTLVHTRVLGWIGLAMAAATACAGLAWFTANNRAARQPAEAGPTPAFPSRFVALHGSAAALTIALAALTALLLRP